MLSILQATQDIVRFIYSSHVYVIRIIHNLQHSKLHKLTENDEYEVMLPVSWDYIFYCKFA